MEFPEDCLYTREHEWARVDEEKGTALIGITDYAQGKLGDIVYVDLPAENDELEIEESFGSVESVKAVSDLFAPLSGKVVEANSMLEESPETVNEDPYGEAWMLQIKLSDTKELETLMTAQEYKEFVAAQDEEA